MGLQSGKKKGAFFVGIVVLSYSLSEAGVTYLHSDHLNSSVIHTDSLGRAVEVQSFTPFGEGGEGYTDQEYDSSADLQSNHARYYDPVLSQFVSVDPVQGNLPYAYANNNPVIFVDPDGNNPLLIPVVTGIGFVAFDYGMAKWTGEDVWYTKGDAAAAFFTGALMGFGGMGIVALSTRLGLSGVGAAVFQGGANYVNITVNRAARNMVYRGERPTEALVESALWPAYLVLAPVDFVAALGSYVGRYHLGPALESWGFVLDDPDEDVPSIENLIAQYHGSYQAGRFPFGDLTGRNPLLKRLDRLAHFHQRLSGSQKELTSILDGLRKGEVGELSREDQIALEEDIQQRLEGIDFLMGQIQQDVTKITHEL
ncbi:MAG: RHS repeat-associated core domain-containing protein [Deltaproteobacteria bacterium]|nr:RHS repeat-associated core domain-containing protein [Deltaproteobacteria bacterium]